MWLVPASRNSKKAGRHVGGVCKGPRDPATPAISPTGGTSRNVPLAELPSRNNPELDYHMAAIMLWDDSETNASAARIVQWKAKWI
jgi:hypothetical protein